MKIKFAKQWDAVSQLWKKFYPITITPAIIDADRGQRLNATLADIYSQLAGTTSAFTDVYIGVGASAASVMVAANHHNAMGRGEHVSLTASSRKVWIILPNTYSPILTMGGIEMPMTAESNITDDGVTYKVFSSSNTYTGTFNVFIF